MRSSFNFVLPPFPELLRVYLILIQNLARLLSWLCLTLRCPYFSLYDLRSSILFSNDLTLYFVQAGLQSNPRASKDAMRSSFNFILPPFPGLLRVHLTSIQNLARLLSWLCLTL